MSIIIGSLIGFLIGYSIVDAIYWFKQDTHTEGDEQELQ